MYKLSKSVTFRVCALRRIYFIEEFQELLIRESKPAGILVKSIQR